MNKTAVCTERNCIRKCRTHHDLKTPMTVFHL